MCWKAMRIAKSCSPILSELELLAGTRDLNIESAYEYGSRVGVWRCLRVFGDRGVPITVYAVGFALE